jgi:hypothetical protein
MKEMRVAVSPEKMESHPDEIRESHIVKKYGKFHGHIVMAGGAEHKIAPQETHAAAHEAIGQMQEAPEQGMQNASETSAPGQMEA